MCALFEMLARLSKLKRHLEIIHLTVINIMVEELAGKLITRVHLSKNTIS